MPIAKKRVVVKTKRAPKKQKSAAEATLKSSYAFYLRRDMLMKLHPCVDGIEFFERMLVKQSRRDSIRLTQQDILRATLSKDKIGYTSVGNMVEWAVDEGIIPKLDLSGETLKNVSFEHAYLPGVGFSSGDFEKSSFKNATLAGANFADSSLMYADFRGASLENANFAGANLYNADFRNADLRGANFSGAQLNGAKLFNAERDEEDAKIPGWSLDEDGDYLCQIVYKRN